MMWFKKIFQKLWNKLRLNFKNIKEFFNYWNKLKPRERDKIREKLGNDKNIQRQKEASKKTLKTILVKDVTNKPLTSYEKDFLKNYQNLFVNEKLPMIEKYDKNHLFMVSNSSWISSVIYYPDTKKVKLLIENKNGYKKWYTFYNVPKTKYLVLIEIGGKYMWDYFGRHYSLNPHHWIRAFEKGKIRIRNHYSKRKGI